MGDGKGFGQSPVRAGLGRVAEIACLGGWLGKYCVIVAFVQVASAALKVANCVNNFFDHTYSR